MGEAKTGRIFQAVAERAVDADMREPDHRDRQDQRLAEPKAERHQRHRHHVAVRGVVDEGAGLGVDQIGGKAQVGREEEDRKDPPRAAPGRVQHQHGRKQRQPFETEQDLDAAGDGAGGLRGWFACVSLDWRSVSPIGTREII